MAGPDLASPGGPTSLTLGNCGRENRRQIGQFSERDAVRLGGQLVIKLEAM